MGTNSEEQCKAAFLSCGKSEHKKRQVLSEATPLQPTPVGREQKWRGVGPGHKICSTGELSRAFAIEAPGWKGQFCPVSSVCPFGSLSQAKRVPGPGLDRGPDYNKGSVHVVLYTNSQPWGREEEALPSVILTLESFGKIFCASCHWLQKWFSRVYGADTQEECSFVALVSDGAGRSALRSPSSTLPFGEGMGTLEQACAHARLWGRPCPLTAASLDCLPRGKFSDPSGCALSSIRMMLFLFHFPHGSTASGFFSPLPSGWNCSSRL